MISPPQHIHHRRFTLRWACLIGDGGAVITDAASNGGRTDGLNRLTVLACTTHVRWVMEQKSLPLTGELAADQVVLIVFVFDVVALSLSAVCLAAMNGALAGRAGLGHWTVRAIRGSRWAFLIFAWFCRWSSDGEADAHEEDGVDEGELHRVWWVQEINLDVSLGCFELWWMNGDRNSSERGDQAIFIDKACQAPYNFSISQPSFGANWDRKG